MIGEFDIEPPFEVGEYKDIKLRVYLPKETKTDNEHLASEYRLAVATALILNRNYEHRKKNYSCSALWYAPILTVDLNNLKKWEKRQVELMIQRYGKYGEVELINND